jgi:hypothetical protein
VLTQAIVACAAIQSFATISSSNSSLLLKEFELIYDKMNSIDGKCNEPSKRKMEWDFENFKNIQIT